jgi:hypothetical protein
VRQIAALERQAVVRIELASLESQTELAVNALSSDAAHAFIERLPTVESLMPSLSFAEIAGENPKFQPPPRRHQ